MSEMRTYQRVTQYKKKKHTHFGVFFVFLTDIFKRKGSPERTPVRMFCVH